MLEARRQLVRIETGATGAGLSGVLVRVCTLRGTQHLLLRGDFGLTVAPGSDTLIGAVGRVPLCVRVAHQ